MYIHGRYLQFRLLTWPLMFWFFFCPGAELVKNCLRERMCPSCLAHWLHPGEKEGLFIGNIFIHHISYFDDNIYNYISIYGAMEPWSHGPMVWRFLELWPFIIYNP